MEVKTLISMSSIFILADYNQIVSFAIFAEIATCGYCIEN